MGLYEDFKAVDDRYHAAKSQRDVFLETSGKEILRLLAGKLFEAHPEFYALGWTQYAPYFNDGDPCDFSVGWCHVMTQDEFKQISAEWAEDEEGEVYELCIQEVENCGELVNRKTKTKAKDPLDDFLALQEDESAMRSLFDTDAYIIIVNSPDGPTIETGEYDHD